MSTYSVADIETLTHIKAHTLRVWERRFGFLKPLRTSTNIRYYSDDQLRKLLNIGVLRRHGYKISLIDRMSEFEMNDLIAKIFEKPKVSDSDDITRLLVSMLELDEIEFDRTFQSQIVRKGLLGTITDVIYPFLHQVGVLWTTNKIVPAQEHYISNLIRQKIIASIEALPAQPASAPTLVLFLVEEESHEIGLLLASYIARDLGWRVIYLGQNVPASDVKEVIKIASPSLIMTMLVSPGPDRIGKYLRRVADDTDIPIIVGGNPDNFRLKVLNENFQFVSSPDQLIDKLRLTSKMRRSSMSS